MSVIRYIINTITMSLTITIPFLVNSIDLTGAGATFPAPIYAKWADSYYKRYGVKVNYQDIGSSSGIKQIIANTIDFGASDIPLNNKQLKDNNLFQFPTVIGGIVLVINVPGIKNKELILNGKILGDIFLGKIKKWNDKAIISLNPQLTLPEQEIAVVRRADGSGTSFIFTSYLAKVNFCWSTTIGIGSSVNWPVGFGGKGNDGVAAFVQRIPGSIGYVEYAYAKQNHLTCVKLITNNGMLVSPDRKSFSASIKNINWDSSLSKNLIDQSGKYAWPITSSTFIVIHKKYNDRNKCKEILKFFDWAYRYGANQANDLDYATLPDAVINYIHMAWKRDLKDVHGNNIW